MGLSSQTVLPPADAQASATDAEQRAKRGHFWGEDESAWDKVREIALDRLDEMMNLEPKVLRGEKAGAIHDFRVASRRFQQAFDLLSPADPPKNLLRMRRSLARSRKALSPVRTLDVFIRRADRILARKRAPRRPAWDAIREYLAAEREKAFARATKKIGKLRLAHDYVRLRRLLDHGACSERRNSEASPAHDGARLGDGPFEERLTQSLTKAWEGFEEAGAQARKSPEGDAVHAARLAAKRLRYLMELVHAFEDPHSGRVISHLRRVQDGLGECHDYEVEEEVLAGMVARPEFLRKHLDLAFEILKLMAQHRKTRERLAAAFPDEFDREASEPIKQSVLALAAKD
ncbi:MAG: CHAD domain-containing protein [Terriglobia bacterium]